MFARLNRITYRAERDASVTFSSLYTLLTVELLQQAFCQLQRDKAPGADGQTVDQYAENLEINLQDLSIRLHRQSYRPQPSLFQSLKDWFRENLTKPTDEVWLTLCAKLQGHFQYYNINDNWRWVMKYREAARRMGLRWMRRRSQNSRVTWETYNN